MKAIRFFALLFSVSALFFFSCEKENVENNHLKVTGSLISHSDCKTNLKSGNETNPSPAVPKSMPGVMPSCTFSKTSKAKAKESFGKTVDDRSVVRKFQNASGPAFINQPVVDFV